MMFDGNFPRDYSDETQRKVAVELKAAVSLTEEVLERLTAATELIYGEKTGMLSDRRVPNLKGEVESLLKGIALLESQTERYIEGTERRRIASTAEEPKVSGKRGWFSRGK